MPGLTRPHHPAWDSESAACVRAGGRAEEMGVLEYSRHAFVRACSYLDEHGEEDRGLRRGRPLHLNRKRCAY